ncbi:MAG: extracellular solute-binding protein [Firmicutes bacterium]|nr:extracellular solute-binding protein [Bacillota bacterium]
MRKKVSILLGLVLCLVLVTSIVTSGQSKSITFWAMPNAPDETHIPWIEEKAKEFQAKTGVKVNLEIVGWDVSWQRISTAIVTGEGVDVFQVGTTWNPQLAATGGLEEINIRNFGGKDAFMKANYESTTYKECDEVMLFDLLKNNAPCISAFGLKKSFGQAVVRNEIDKYATKFDNAVNVLGNKGLIPITFTEYAIDDRLMSPKRGAPINVSLSHFIGWKSNFTIAYTDHVYSIEQIVNIINLAGFGLGIGSGRSSGYGRYEVVDFK